MEGSQMTPNVVRNCGAANAHKDRDPPSSTKSVKGRSEKNRKTKKTWARNKSLGKKGRCGKLD